MACQQDRFPCRFDCCGSDQFCDDDDKRCVLCSDKDLLCGTDKIPAQCLYYCHMLIEHLTSSDDTHLLANPVLGIIGIISTVLLCFIIVLIVCWICKRPKWLMTLLQRCFKCHVFHTFARSVQTSLASLFGQGIETFSDVSLSVVTSVPGNGSSVTDNVTDPSQPLLNTTVPSDATQRGTEDPAANPNTLGVSTGARGDEDIVSLTSTQETSVDAAARQSEVSIDAESPPEMATETPVQRGIFDAGVEGGPAGRVPGTGLGSGNGNRRQSSNQRGRPQTAPQHPDIDLSYSSALTAPSMTLNIHNYNGGTSALATLQDLGCNVATNAPSGGSGAAASRPSTTGSSGRPPPAEQRPAGHGHPGNHQSASRDDRLQGVTPSTSDMGPIVYAVDAGNRPVPNARRDQHGP